MASACRRQTDRYPAEPAIRNRREETRNGRRLHNSVTPTESEPERTPRMRAQCRPAMVVHDGSAAARSRVRRREERPALWDCPALPRRTALRRSPSLSSAAKLAIPVQLEIWKRAQVA